MSNNESFIDEVTEEVRRDQLFQVLRRYGWIAVGCVLLLVGGAAYSEWRKAQETARAQAVGDAVLAALQTDDDAARAAALQGIESESGAKAVVTLLAAADLVDMDDVAGAAAALDGLAADPDVEPLYRDLAALKSLMVQADTMDPATRRASLEALAAPGAPFRLLAQEQIALADLAEGNTDAAIAAMQAIVDDAEVTRGLRGRAQSLIVALGGTLDGAEDAGQ